MSVEDMLEVTITGVSWTDLRQKAFEIGADFFKTDPANLELLPFIAAPSEEINDGTGARIRTVYEATITVALREKNGEGNL